MNKHNYGQNPSLGAAGLSAVLVIQLFLQLGCEEGRIIQFDEPFLDVELEENEEFICYRGDVRVAERDGDLLFVEGDIEVTEQEQWCDDVNYAEMMGARRAPSSPGSVWSSSVYGVVWTGGVVPYQIDSSFSATEEDNIEDAMRDWMAAAPGLTFRERNASDTSWLDVILSDRCSSGYGMITGARTVRLTSECTSTFSVHHELGHALGLQHEHTRADRDDYVTVTSNNANYKIDDGADMFDYDFDSIMHYGLGGSIAVKAGVTVPDGVTVGQSDHLSTTDIAAMAAMYPRARVKTVLFKDTGQQPLCELDGRERDVNTDYERISSTSSLDGDGVNVNTNNLSEGEFSVKCRIKSLFWSRDYEYPNSSYTESINSAPSGDVITYNSTQNIRVLNPGLIKTLFVI
jgi:hypothetical protein